MSKTQGTEMAHKLIQTQHDVNKNGLDDAMQRVIQPLIQEMYSLHAKIDALSNKLDIALLEPVQTHDWRCLDVERFKFRDRRDSDLVSECSRHTAESDDSGYVIVSMPGGNVEPRSKKNRTRHLTTTDLKPRRIKPNRLKRYIRRLRSERKRTRNLTTTDLKPRPIKPDRLKRYIRRLRSERKSFNMFYKKI